VEVLCEEASAHLGLETQRQWLDRVIARTTPCPVRRVLAGHRAGPGVELGGQIAVPVTVWSHAAEQSFADGLALVHWHLWCARSVVNAAAEPALVPCPQQIVKRLLTGLPGAA
jgi:hypothetical protein